MCNNFVEPYEKMSDEEIVNRFLSGNYSEIQILINRYMPLIIKTATAFHDCGLDVEDLIQEGIISVFFAVKNFDQDKAKFSTYVSQCIKRAILVQIKSLSALKRIPSNLITPFDNATTNCVNISDPESIYLSKESYDSFKKNISLSLSELEYKVFCAFVSGDSYSKISTDLNISVKSVDNSLKRIRAKLKK